MLTIHKNGRTLQVTDGAFQSIYRHTGWSVVSEAPVEAPQEPAEAPGVAGGSNHTPQEEKPTSELPTAPEKPSPSEEEEDLSTLSMEELRQYGSLLGIKVSGMSRKNLIKAIQENQ